MISIIDDKPTEDRDVHVIQHLISKWKDYQSHAIDWQHGFTISEAYWEYCDKFLKMLTQFSSVWNGHSVRISIVKHKMKLFSNSSCVLLAPYLAGSTVEVLVPRDWKNVFQNVFEPAQTEWAPSFGFAPKNNESPCLCFHHCKLNSSSWQDPYPFPRMDVCIYFIGETTVFTKLEASSAYWQMKEKTNTNILGRSHCTTAFSVLYVCRLVWRTNQKRSRKRWRLSYQALKGKSLWSVLMTWSSSQKRPRSKLTTWSKC